MELNPFERNTGEEPCGSSRLEERLTTAELRLTRALLCLDRCQKELAELTRQQQAAGHRMNRLSRTLHLSLAATLLLPLGAAARSMGRRNRR